MKICFIVNANSPHARRWIEPVIETGYQVYIISYLPDPPEISGALEIIDLTKFVNLPKVRFAQWGFWLRRYLKEIQPDILHAHQIPGAGWLASMSGFKPMVITGWGSDILIEPQRSIFRRLLVKFVFHRSQALTVPSKLMYEAALKLRYPESCLHLIPWGIEVDIFHPNLRNRDQVRKELGIPGDAQVILSPRRIHPICNQDTILEAFSQLAKDYPKAHLVFIDFRTIVETRNQLQAQIDHLGLAHRIHWLPPQETSHQMADLYRMADTVISVPSSEGYGFTAYEAMACGTPTILSNLPVFEGEVVNGVHARKVDAQDVSQTWKAMTELITDQKLREKLHHAGIVLALKKSTKNRNILTEKLYQDLKNTPSGSYIQGKSLGTQRK